MKRQELSFPQWGCLLWAAALAPAAELLPGGTLELAGRGAWLAPLAAGLALLPLLWLAGRRDGYLPDRTLADRAVLAGFGLWLYLLLILRLGLCARRMLWSGGERDGAVWYFLLTLAGLSLWMGESAVPAFGRAGQIFLALLLAAAGLVLGLSLPQLRVDRILPLWKGDVVPVLKSGVVAAGSLCWAAAPMLLLPRRACLGRQSLLWSGGGCLLLTLAQGIILGNLGAGLAEQSDSAFFALTKSVGVEGAFQRVESVIAALWMLSDLVLCIGLLQSLDRAAGAVIAKLKEGATIPFFLLTATGGALWLCRRGMPLEVWNREWVWLGNLVACIGMTLWCFVKTSRQGGYFVEHCHKEGEDIGGG